MKRILIFSSILILLFCYSAEAGIKVFKPALNEVIYKGTDYNIQWLPTGKGQDNVRIRLLNPVTKGVVLKITDSTPDNGHFLWKKHSIDGVKPGAYIIRVRNNITLALGHSAKFEIANKKDTNIGIIQVESLKTGGEKSSQPHRHRAPAVGAPSGASFSIKRILVNYFSPVVIDKVVVQVNYISKTPFSFAKYKGHPTHGPVYLNCKISNPIWPKDERWSHLPASKGPPTPKVIHNHRHSVRYGGKQHLEYAPYIMDPGQGMFELIIAPKHSGKLRGLHTMQNMAGAVFSPSDVCHRFYSPKLQVRIFIHTKEGIKVLYKQLYLNNAPHHMFKIGGKVNICSGRYVNW